MLPFLNANFGNLVSLSETMNRRVNGPNLLVFWTSDQNNGPWLNVIFNFRFILSFYFIFIQFSSYSWSGLNIFNYNLIEVKFNYNLIEVVGFAYEGELFFRNEYCYANVLNGFSYYSKL